MSKKSGGRSSSRDDSRDAERQWEADRQEVDQRVNSGTPRAEAERQVRDENYQRDRDHDEYVRKSWGS